MNLLNTITYFCIYAGNEYDIISPNQTGDWNTVNKTRYQEPIDYGMGPAGHPTWPAGANPTWGGARIDSGPQLTK